MKIVPNLRLRYDKLQKPDKVFFPTHEGLINLRDLFGIEAGNDTTQVRATNFLYAKWLLGQVEGRSKARVILGENEARKIIKRIRNIDVYPVDYPSPLPKHGRREDEPLLSAFQLIGKDQSNFYYWELMKELEKYGAYLPRRSSIGCPLTDSYIETRSSRGYLIRQQTPCLTIKDLLCIMTYEKKLNCDSSRYRSTEPIIPVELAEQLARKTGLPD